jgi:heptosyltransferase-2
MAPVKVQLPKHHVRKLSLIKAGLDLFRDPVPSMRDMYLKLAGGIGAPVRHTTTKLTPTREAREAAARFMESGGLVRGKVVAMAPGARWETKRWPAGHFHTLALELEALGYGVLVVGDSSEKELCGSIATGTKAINASGKLSLGELAAALGNSSVLVTNDSAPLHMAEAVGTPVVALFGPTVRQFGYFPLLPDSIVMERHLDCRPCSRNGSGPCRIERRECLEDILPSEVLGNVLRLAQARGESA